MTALTLDTIALCGFDYRFNSLLPGHAAPVRRGDGAEPGRRRRSRREGAAAPAQAADAARRRQLRGGPGVQIRSGRGADRGAARGRATRRDNTDLLGRMLTGVDKQSGRGAAGREHRRPVPHLPRRRPRDDQRAVVVRHLLPDEEPAVAERARAEVDEVLGDDGAQPDYEQVHRLTYVRQVLDETLRLWPTAPMFTRMPLQDTVVGGQVRLPEGHRAADAGPRCCTGTRASGARTPRNSTPTTSPPERIKACRRTRTAVRHRPARLHRPPVRAAGGHARPRHAAAAVRIRRSPQLPVAHQGDAHRQARRLLDQGASADRTRSAGHRPGAAGHGGASRAPRTAPAPTAATARHPVAGAVRVEPGHGRGHRQPARPRGHRTRLPGHRRRARRPWQRPARARAPC